ncbi:MAG: diguanylate cyclase [Pseudomonadota bacterium]
MYGLLVFVEVVSAALLIAGAVAFAYHRRTIAQVARAPRHGELDVSLKSISRAADLFWQTNREGLVTGAGGRLMGQLIPDESDIIGRHYLKTVALQPQEMTKMLAALTNGSAYSDIHTRFQAEDGRIYIISLSGSPRRDEAGEIIGYFGLGTDVTERVAAQDELKFLAEHDPLTELANRRAFEAKMNQLLTSEGPSSFAIIAIDLDGFKAINDTHGHDIGDHILRAVASRIRMTTRSTDWAARIGGDEFVFVAEQVRDEEAAAAVAERLIRVLSEPYIVDSRTLRVGASAGVSLAGDPRPRAVDLMKQADEALYDAKAAGKGCFRFHNGIVDRSSNLFVVSNRKDSSRPKHARRRMGERRETDDQTSERCREDRKA